MTCGRRRERFDRLHEGDWNVAKTDVSQNDVDAEDEGHGEDSPPRVAWLDVDQGFDLENPDCHVGSDGGADEVNARNGQGEREIEFLR